MPNASTTNINSAYYERLVKQNARARARVPLRVDEYACAELRPVELALKSRQERRHLHKNAMRFCRRGGECILKNSIRINMQNAQSTQKRKNI